MNRTVKGCIAGALALASVAVATAEAQAMPIQSLGEVAHAASGIDQVWCCRYGWRGYGWGWRRPFYGYRYGWGWRRRSWGWRRW